MFPPGLVEMIMFGARWRLFRLFGLPISLDLSWFLILILVTWSLAMFWFAPKLPGMEPWVWWVLGVAGAVAFFICIVLHELGHALVARTVGIPIRGITLFLFGGVAEMGAEPTSAADEFLMAIAGPLVSFVLAVVFAVLFYIGWVSHWPKWLVVFFITLAAINGMVLLFNLIPAFPLDGGRVFRALLWAATGKLRRATRWASAVGQGFAWLLIAAGVWQFMARDFFGGIWWCLIGLFLNSAARNSYQQVIVQEVLRGEPVRRFMNPEPVVVPPSTDLRHWVEDYVYRFHRKAFPVASNGHLEGFVSTQSLSAIPREEWDRHTVGEVMRHDVAAVSIPPDADALQALSRMQQLGSSRLLVTEGDHLIGIISLKDLLRFLNLKLDLEPLEK
jgi:Zn-dependent protease/CBS domain-containing protein